MHQSQQECTKTTFYYKAMYHFYFFIHLGKAYWDFNSLKRQTIRSLKYNNHLGFPKTLVMSQHVKVIRKF